MTRHPRRNLRGAVALLAAALATLGAAGVHRLAGAAAAGDDGPYTTAEATREAYGRPFATLDEAGRPAFFRGRSLFRQSWVVAPAQDAEVDGLGPLYNRLACLSCHPKNGRGQAPAGPDERMQSMLVRLSLPGVGPHGGPRHHPAYGDQLNEEGIPGVPGEGRAAVHWEEETVTLGDGEAVRLRRPRLEFRDLAYGPLDGTLVSPRVGQAVFGLGLLDAVPDRELVRMAREAKPDGVGGRVNRVWDAAGRRTVAGRFGWKANMPSLRQQIAGAMAGDLGITSPLFPAANCTPVQTACRAAPNGGTPELSGAQLDAIETYLARLAAPRPRPREGAERGAALFAAAGCPACHRPRLTTGATAAGARHGIPAGTAFAPYTDLLVHDMGDGLADDRPDFAAGGREWRTAPLWGLGLQALVNGHTYLLHDGRARDATEAILWHGGEARIARDRFAAMARADRAALLAFLDSL
ncbi:di-heme oxidoreductase family protein [Oryzomicrobium sp.]|uniref:di-heme oxidoreductase family protein n=1 Tax=Oryzomicrobium sp. TaxID=1911578 RepID=UPI002FDF2342